MAIIDTHVHLYPSEASRTPGAWAEARGEKLWALLSTRQRKDGTPVQGFPTMAKLLHDMNEAGIRKAVLLGWYWENHATCVEHNKFYASCIKAYPTRFAAFATVHPAAGEAALDEVKRAKDAGFSGLGELSPHAQQVSLNDPIWRKLIALAGKLNLPVNLHVTDPRSKPYPGRVETPLADFIGLAREFPETKFILAHWGGGLAFDSESRKLQNVFYDTSASPLLYDADVWRHAPEGRVLFGSDYPLVLYPKKGAVPEFANLVREAREAGADESLFETNAMQLMQLHEPGHNGTGSGRKDDLKAGGQS